MSQLTICLIIFVITVIGYCSGKYSLATIAITSLMALILTGCLDAKTGLSYFGNSTVVMIGSMCVVAAGFNRTRFCTSIATGISRLSKGSPAKMMFGYVLIGVLLSQFIQSPVVVFGIVAPLAMISGEAMGLKPSKIMFPLGIATVITCSTLPVGAGATVPAELNGYLESYGYTKYLVGQLEPMIGRLPMLIISILYFSFFAIKLAPDEPVTETSYDLKTKAAGAGLKPLQEYAGIVIFFADALALMFSGPLGLETWQITVIGALAMILFGVLKPKEASGAIPLSMLLLIVGTQAIPYIMSYGGYDQKSMLKQSPIIALISCVVTVGWIMTIFPIQ